MSKYLILDTEASGTKTYRRFCNPLDPNHQVDLLGYQYQNDVFGYQYALMDGHNNPALPDLTDVNVIVGHNLKFDLLWYWGDPKLQAWLKNGGKVWDTLTVQYLLDAQQKIPRNLDVVATKFGGTLKDSSMKEYYKKGGQSKDVPIDTLIAYNKEDITNTNIILQAQIKIAKKKGMLPLINIYMDHLISIIEMEYNGIHINIEELIKKYEELKIQERHKHSELVSFALSNGYKDFNPLSLDHLSLFLFGGIIKSKEKVKQFGEDGLPLIVKTTGLQKERYEIVERTQKRQLETAPYPFLRKNKKGLYHLNNQELEELYESKVIKDGLIAFIKNILEYRKLTKKIGTYYEGLLECRSVYTNCVHPEFKASSTDTGRLSCGNPNAQNLHPDVLDYIDSRYGKDGVIIEIDCSQLEVRLQAYITDCQAMCTDIQNGIDFHILRLAYAEGLSYEETFKRVQESHEWALKRKHAKVISFRKAYGASPETIAEEIELSLEAVKAVFYQEDLKYPEVNQFYEEVSQEVATSRVVVTRPQPIKDKHTGLIITREGEQQAYGMYKSITGKEYIFPEKAVLTKTGNVFRYFSMPKLQNSPVQGIASDYVSCQVGQFYRWLKKSGEKCFMINEIHDAILLDCHSSSLTNVTKNAKIILENTEKFEKLTGKKFEIPMDVEIKVGSTWGELKNE